jgi:hypothetical protein
MKKKPAIEAEKDQILSKNFMLKFKIKKVIEV